MIKRTFLILALACLPLRAATFTAASVALPDVLSAYSLCSNGDTLAIPAGSSHWISNFVPSKAITISGAGIGQTTIFDQITNRTALLAFVSTLDNGLVYRITGISFKPDPTVTSGNIFGVIQCTGYTPAFRLDHCSFELLEGHAVSTVDWVRGVIDHCNFENKATYQVLRLWHMSWGGPQYFFGDGSWSLPMSWGTTNVMDIESCTLSNVLAGNSFTDGFAGARLLFRFNSCTNGSVQTHGTDSTGRYRSAIQHEVYGNTFVSSGGLSVTFERGGSWLICSNTCSGYQGLEVMVSDGAFGPSVWYEGGWNGTNRWCSNSPTIFASGSATAGASLTMTDSGASWTPGQWNGYTLRNISLGSYNGITTSPFSFITTNTANTITFFSNGFGTNMTFAAGQAYEIRKVLIALDQIGRGTGNLFTNNPPYDSSLEATPIGWPNQSSEPCRYWANTMNGSPVNGGPSIFPAITENIDWFNSARPGWTPLIFPHPLVTDGGGCTYSIIPTSITASVGGTSGSVSITTSTNTCTWTSTANVGWLHVTGGSSGTGNGSTSYSVDVNSGASRSGSITIAGQSFQVTQDGTVDRPPIVIIGDVKLRGGVNLRSTL